MAGENEPYTLPFQFTHPGKGATITLQMLLHTHMFQFTHPGKGATSNTLIEETQGEFQFTHPGKGATSTSFAPSSKLMAFQFTHPGKGATDRGRRGVAFVSGFNSRTLGRVRLPLGRRLRLLRTVSIHAPWEGCDKELFGIRDIPEVSIHAPWEGCDFKRR